MKRNIFAAICCLIGGMALTSCNDWLNVQPRSQVDDKELFESESGSRRPSQAFTLPWCRPVPTPRR